MANLDEWQPEETAPEGVAVKVRSVEYKWQAVAKKIRHCDDGEGGRFPETTWTILHYNGEALMLGFYGLADMEWAPLVF